MIIQRGATRLAATLVVSISLSALPLATVPALATKPQLGIRSARTVFHIKRNSGTVPTGLSPAVIKSAYNISGDGSGTIAIIDAYDAPSAQADLNTFSTQFSLPVCNLSNPCFEKYKMSNAIRSNSGWALEASLDTQWAHAIAPGARILLVEARSSSISDLLKAVDYARNRSDVVAISMSWGGSEFSSESSYDSYFTSSYNAAFFASSGDSGTGVQWPAVSPNVTGVGGTKLVLSGSTFVSETAWSGSGGGISRYELRPSFQAAYGLTSTQRSVPDVSYNADPNSGVAVYDSTSYSGQRGWFQVGGTSAGAPQWAAIYALGSTATNSRLYTDAKLANSSAFLRDITAGTNGSCGVVCSAGPAYDTVTGLGSPVAINF